MRTVKSTHIPEEYKVIKHSSGLDILLYPMKGYNSAYALFATKYGSVDTTFKTENQKDFTTVPEGIAHFLEHKLFESDKGDAFARYAKTGASANAYTSFDRTAYLFLTTDNFKPSMEILLDFVTDPYFTKESVEKEQGIIGQEIKMYQDDPNWRVFFGLLGGMYKNNPVAIDIAGTIESIAEIDAELLHSCYNTFYNLNNMVLVVSGNFNPEDVLELADRILKPAKKVEVTRHIPEEPDEINKDYVSINLPISQSMFQLGFKGKTVNEQEDFKREIQLDILMDILFGKTSDFYNNLYDQGLINATFSAGAESGRGYFYAALGGESKDPKAVKEAVIVAVNKAKQQGLSREDFDHCKKAVWGTTVRAYGSVEGVGGIMLASHFVGFDSFKMLEVIEKTTFADMTKMLDETLRTDRIVLSLVEPIA